MLLAFEKFAPAVILAKNTTLYPMEKPSDGNYISRGVIYINDPTTCFVCKKADLEIDAKYCSSCGFPQNGDQEEQREFYREHILKEREFKEAIKNVKSAQNTLFITAGVCLISGFVMSAIEPEDGQWTLIAGLFLTAAFLGLGFLGKRHPLPATIGGLAIYITMMLLGLILTIYEGEKMRGSPIGLVDILIIVFIGKGISGALKAERLRKEKGWEWRESQ